MPPPPPGGTKKKKKGRPPKHQNSFAFRHNPKSKKTDKILASPNVGVCRRCYDKIEWRKKYRKYKPLSQPGKCNLCFQKNIVAAYHTICTSCACSDRAIKAMEKRQRETAGGSDSTANETTRTTTTTPTLSNNCEFENGDTFLANDTAGEGATSESLPCTIVVDDATNSDRKSSSKLRIRVCAVCTNEPAISKYSNASAEDMDIIEVIQELEDALETGLHIEDGHKMTLRELKGVERKIEKYQLELKQRRSKAKQGDEDEEELDEEEREDKYNTDDEGSADSSIDAVGNDGRADSGFEDDAQEVYETDDPFLLATGGKALVGEAYQKMVLERDQHQK